MQRALLERLNLQARQREDRAAAELRAAQARLQRVEQTQQQLQSFAADYRNNALAVPAAQGAAARLDSMAFGQRLQAVAQEQSHQIEHQRGDSAAARQALQAASQRRDMLERLLQRARRREHQAADQRRLLETEESIAARWRQTR